MKKDEKQSIILLAVFIAILLCSVIFGGCMPFHYLDSDPFYKSDTIHGRDTNNLYEIGLW